MCGTGPDGRRCTIYVVFLDHKHTNIAYFLIFEKQNTHTDLFLRYDLYNLINNSCILLCVIISRWPPNHNEQ